MEFSFRPPELWFEPTTEESGIGFAELTGYPEKGERLKPEVIGRAVKIPMYDTDRGFEAPMARLEGCLDAQD